MTIGYSVLFCDCARSEARMSKANAPTGVMAKAGFSANHLRKVAADAPPGTAEIVELTPVVPQGTKADDACVLVLRPNMADLHKEALKEVKGMAFDTFTASRGKVLNAHSRHLVFLGSNGARAPDPVTGEHTVVDFSTLPALNRARTFATGLLGTEDCVSGCVLKYPDIDSCGIGWHGDGERRQTIIYRVGSSSTSRPLCFQWYLRGLPIGSPVSIVLNHGDMAIASDKAVGTDWKQKIVPTLRHATGFLKQGPVPNPTSKSAKAAAKRKLEPDQAVPSPKQQKT